MTGKEFVKLMSEATKKRSDAWRLQAHALNDEQIDILEQTLKSLDNDEEKVRSLVHEKRENLQTMHPEEEYSDVLSKLAESLYDDLSVYTNSEYDSLLKISGLAIIEVGKIHAAITNRDIFQEKLEGFSIFINIGTYYALQLLLKGFIVEHFENEFEPYRKEGKPFVDLAMKIYKTQHSEPTRKIFWYEFPKEIQVSASAAQSASVIKVMQFIALHELGHYVNGDFDIMKFHSFAMYSNDQDRVKDELLRARSYEAEYRADRFALNALLDTDMTNLSKWSSFYPIFYFLAWLDAIEKKEKTVLSEIHPNPLKRAYKLKERLLELTGNEDYGYSVHLDDAVKYFKHWSNE